MLKAACTGTVYGQDAVDAFGDGSNGAQFDCVFINGVSTITFDGAVISGADENGDQVFSHELEHSHLATGKFRLILNDHVCFHLFEVRLGNSPDYPIDCIT